MSPIEISIPSLSRVTAARLVVLGWMAGLAVTTVSAWHPSSPTFGDASALPGFFALGWIAAQSFLLTIPGILIGGGLARFWPRAGWWAGVVIVQSIVFVVLCDVIAFRWMGERFLSPATWRVLTSLAGPLGGHVTSTMMYSAMAALVAFVVYVLLSWIGSTKIANVWSRSARIPTPFTSVLLSIGLCLVVAVPAIWNRSRTLSEMAAQSARHPFCAFGLVRHRGVGRSVAASESVDQVKTSTMESAIAARDRDQRQLSVQPAWLAESIREDLPDVVIVVIESFRPELVTAEVMPHLSQYAEQGVFCRQHFSGGNATNHGMFSLVNGLEAIWYERSVRYSPLLNRLFRQAGYELGFFGGHNDWRKFLMDGYISDQHYDVFEIGDPNWLESDRQATQHAAVFLDPAGRQKRPARLAVLYLYSTHANYHSFAADQVFQPAADDRFLIPFTENSKPAIWNRYKNSARSIDRFLAAVMARDRVVIVTGDHGESFLEDGVCGHGVRISKYQNMTPAVVYVPGRQPRQIDAATMHADLLPTLLSATGITVTRPDTFDGDDLLSVSDEDLADRLFATRNYLSDDLAIIGPWTLRPDEPFGYRASVSLKNLRAAAFNAIDAAGNELSAATSESESEKALQRWRLQRFGKR